MDAKYFNKPKVKADADGKPMLTAKGRLTPKGFQDPEKDQYRVDSPTIARWTLFVAIVHGLSNGWELMKGDISGAFLQGDPLERQNVWIRMPMELVNLGLIDPRRRWRRVKKAVYGMNEAPRKWWLALCRAALDLGFVQSLIDPCLLIHMEDSDVNCVIGMYVDDLVACGQRQCMEKLMSQLSDRYPMGQMEKAWELSSFSYVGTDLVFGRNAAGKLVSVHVNQTAYVKSKFPQAVKELEEALAVKSPVQNLCTPKQADAYRSANGKLAWAGNTRPQDAYDVSERASSAKAPTFGDAKHLLQTMKRVLETAGDGILLQGFDPQKLGVAAFGDASFANRVGERTQGGFVVILTDNLDATQMRDGMLSGSVCVFRSTKIPRVCVGTFDAETIEAVETTDAALCAGYLLTELRGGRMPSIGENVLMRGFGHHLGASDRMYPPPTCWISVFSDGNGTVTAVQSTKPVTNRRRRIDVALLREAVDDGVLTFTHCDGKYMVADGLTKKLVDRGVLRKLAHLGSFRYY